jgi:DNA-binding MarR family transcriptional regulator
MASKDVEAREAWRFITDVFLSGEMQESFHAACAEVDLPHPGALKALILLDSDDPPSMRVMAEGLHCDASYITGLVDALEALHYVERRTSPTDRRVKLVHLTATGRRARDRALEVIQRPPKGLESLTAAETRTLAALMRKVVEASPTT